MVSSPFLNGVESATMEMPTIEPKKEETVEHVTTIGLDIAKRVFHVIGNDAQGRERTKKVLRRHQVLAWFANHTPCLVGIEACGGAHEWARQIRDLGHQVRLLPPQHVKPYVRGSKNDFNDARAIAEAVTRPALREVPIKSREQQDLQALHRLRQGCVAQRTALANQLRGLLAEYGLVLPQGLPTLRRRLPELLEDANNGLSPLFRELLAEGYAQLCSLDEQLDRHTRRITREAREQEAQQRLQTIPGFGPIVASLFHAAIGSGAGYRRGRDVAASLGLVPRQHSSGGRTVLLGISKRGDSYLRCLLIHGARAVVNQADRKDDRLSRWVNRLVQTRGKNRATVALANKLARIGWAVLRHQGYYQPA